MGHSLPDHDSATQRQGDPTTGGAPGLAGAGDQYPGFAAVAAGLAADVPWRLVCGASVSSVEGPAAGDSPAVRAAGRPGTGIDPSGDAGVAGVDVVRGLGAAGARSEWREAGGVVSRPAE